MRQIILLLQIFASLVLPAVAIGLPPGVTTCPPKRCGNLPVAYPFWLDQPGQSPCGWPSFLVNCTDDGHAFLKHSFMSSYRVRDIFYDNSTFLAADYHALDLINSTGKACHLPYRNVSDNLGLAPFSISRCNRMLLFFNCTDPRSVRPPESVPVKCVSRMFVKLGGNYDPDCNRTSSGSCHVYVMPAVGFPGAEARDYVQLMKDGFLLSWSVAGNCSRCMKSGGQCGYDSAKSAFACICSYGPDPVRCDKKKPRTVAIAAGASAGGIVVLGLAGLVGYKRRHRRQARHSQHLTRSGSSMQSYSKELELAGSQFTHIFTYEELEEATDRFSSSRELGDGGFGTVYKGKLRDGRVVAVKRLYKNNYKRVEQFLNEVDILSRLRHQNLVTLYGCTSRSSRELLLVYEFIPNGTVADNLHGHLAAEQGRLTWPVRMNIAIETADALAYLHAVEIIHRDVKTNNILLDNGFHVKVADFGLSRLFPLDVTHVSTVPQGTPGYVDPVYHQCYKLTDRSDVYSFGVVLVELISSKPAVDMNRSHSEINLANLALTKIQNYEIDQLVDPELGYHSDNETKRTIDLVAELAFRCLQLDRDLRPSIKEVSEILVRIKNGAHEAGKITKDDTHLLSTKLEFSPSTVIRSWTSQSTASNVSG